MNDNTENLSIERVAINQATTRKQWTHQQSLEGYARHGIRQVNLWRDEILELGIGKTRNLLEELSMEVIGLNRIGPVFDENGCANKGFLDDTKRGIEEACELKATNLMFFPGTSLPFINNIKDARKYATDSLLAALELARQAGVELVLEPLHPMIAGDRSCVNTMKQCNDICDVAGGGLGIVVDVYHVWWDPELKSEIARAGSTRLSGFQINDWLVPTNDLLNDRGMMGDGVIEIKKIRHWMEHSGYKGPIEIELFSDYWWNQDPDRVVRLAIERTLALA